MTKKMGKPAQRLPLLKITTIFLLLIPLILLAFSYTNIYPPLVDKKYIFTLDSFVASIPLIPKTPKQVLSKAITSSTKLSSYSAGATVSLKSDRSEQIELSFAGSVNKAGLFGSTSQSSVKGTVKGELNGEINFQTVSKEENLYFRTVGNLGLPDFDPTLLGSDWYKMDLEKFQEGLGVESRGDSEIVDDISKQAETYWLRLVDSGLFSKLTSSKTLKIGGVEYLKYSFDIDSKLIQDFNLFNGYRFTNPDLSLLVNKKSTLIEIVELVAEVDPEKANIVKTKMNFRFEFRVFNINKEQKIEIPEATKAISGPIELSLVLEGRDDVQDTAFVGAAQKAVDRGQNFLTVERILRVILLLPKAIYYN
jgi:hypothetical protein